MELNWQKNKWINTTTTLSIGPLFLVIWPREHKRHFQHKVRGEERVLSAWRAAQVKLPQTTSTTCCGQSGSIYPPGNSTSASETPITIVSHSTLLRAPRSLDRRVSLFLYSKKTSNPASDFTTSLSQPYVFLSVFIQFRPSGLNNSNTPPPTILNFLTALSLQTLWIWKNPHISLLQWNCWALLEKITQWYGWLAPQISLGKVQQSFDLILISFLSHSPQTVILSLYLSLYCFPTSPFLWVGKKSRLSSRTRYHLLGPTSLSNPSVYQPSLPFLLSQWRGNF